MSDFCGRIQADEHAHHGHSQHGHEDDQPIERPVVFLDKSPKIVEYQLKRLDNRRLLLVERSDDHQKYAPVHAAILSRAGMARQARDQAVQALARIRATSVVEELLAAIGRLKPVDDADQATAALLSAMMLDLPVEQLTDQSAAILNAASQKNALLQSAGLAGLIATGQGDLAWENVVSDDGRIAWLRAIVLLPPRQRIDQRHRVLSMLNGQSTTQVVSQVLLVLAGIPTSEEDSFQRISAYITGETFDTTTPTSEQISKPSVSQSAVKALLSISDEFRVATTSQQVASRLVANAEQVETADRTSDSFIDSMVLAEQLLKTLNEVDAKELRNRMRAISVRLVRIRTVHEEMRYDLPYFAVEAGRPVQIVLQNEDLMPHNFVITRPGQLQQVAAAGAELGPSPGFQNLPYVPNTSDVLFATNMVEAGKQVRLTFNAPTEPGEYPYVCTFPRHWMRMYGVMVVVPDLDAWQRSPVAPTDPLGNNRSFVQNWKLADFPEAIQASLEGRKLDAGKALFREATCLQCHKMHKDGGAVGPDLTDVVSRWKNDKRGILREMLEPSWKIDPKYAVQVIVLSDGRTKSGIIKSEDDKTVFLLTNPERPEPESIARADIEEIIPSATSMMPKALLDKFTQDEILDILNYITTEHSDDH
ncbi:MAG: c-type cytochrome [Planctomycetaceae bacterium]|nr:c-type cytochrome [Planctomycetaceae bacterium]